MLSRKDIGCMVNETRNVEKEKKRCIRIENGLSSHGCQEKQVRRCCGILILGVENW